jgi:transcription antitermination factor NusG
VKKETVTELAVARRSAVVRTYLGDEMIDTDAAFPWYALQVRPRFEKQVASALLGKGYEGFLPLYRCRNRWSDRIKEIELPLFSGYMFCRFDVNRRLPILMTPGVMHIVGIGKTPVPVEESEVAALQTIVVSGLQAGPWPYLQVGQRVTVDRGALAGVEGILIAIKGRNRLVVSVTLLQRSVAVEVDEHRVWPVDPRVQPVPAAFAHA